MVVGSNVWRARPELIYYGLDKGRSLSQVLRPDTLMAERSRGLPGTNNTDNTIQNSERELAVIGQGIIRI